MQEHAQGSQQLLASSSGDRSGKLSQDATSIGDKFEMIFNDPGLNIQSTQLWLKQCFCIQHLKLVPIML